MTYGVVTFKVFTVDFFNVQRRRQIINNCIQKLLNTLVFVCRTNKYRVELARKNTFTDSSLQHVYIDVCFLKNSFHKLIREVCSSIQKHVAALLSNLFEFVGDCIHNFRVNHSLSVFLEVPCLHGNEVDKTPEVRLGAHRNLRSYCICS